MSPTPSPIEPALLVAVPMEHWGDRMNPLEGMSLVKSLSGQRVKEAAFSQYPRKPKDMSEPWKSNGIGHDEVSGTVASREATS